VVTVTNERRRELFAAGAFCDFAMPQWRLQAQGTEDIVRLRKSGHPGPSRLRSSAAGRGNPVTG